MADGLPALYGGPHALAPLLPQVASAFSVIRASRVLSAPQGDWRLWDWHCIALVLDAQLTCAPVLAEVLAKTQFMQKLGEAFGRFAQGVNVLEAAAAADAAGSAPAPAPAAPGGAAPAGGSSSERGSIVGGAALLSGGVSLASAPWSPPVLRLLACARQWLLLLVHHPAGRELLLSRPKGSSSGAAPAAASGSQPPPTLNIVLEVALALWAQLSRPLRALLSDNASASKVAPASGLAASVAGRLLVSAASRALAAFGSGGAGGEKLYESPEAAAAAAIKDVVGAGVSGRAHIAMFGRAEFSSTAARELLSLLGVLASTERGREVLQVRARSGDPHASLTHTHAHSLTCSTRGRRATCCCWAWGTSRARSSARSRGSRQRRSRLARPLRSSALAAAAPTPLAPQRQPRAAFRRLATPLPLGLPARYPSMARPRSCSGQPLPLRRCLCCTVPHPPPRTARSPSRLLLSPLRRC